MLFASRLSGFVSLSNIHFTTFGGDFRPNISLADLIMKLFFLALDKDGPDIVLHK